MKSILSGFFFILLVGCSPLSFDRDGNEYVLSMEKRKVTLITVGDDFHYSHQETIDGAPVFFFYDKNKDRRVVVLDSFAWYDRKGNFKNAAKTDDEKMVAITSDYLQRTLLTRTNETRDVITKQMAESVEEVNNKWITLFVAYSEYLSPKYQFDSWESIPKVEKETFLNSFDERADEAVKFNNF